MSDSSSALCVSQQRFRTGINSFHPFCDHVGSYARFQRRLRATTHPD